MLRDRKVYTHIVLMPVSYYSIHACNIIKTNFSAECQIYLYTFSGTNIERPWGVANMKYYMGIGEWLYSNHM